VWYRYSVSNLGILIHRHQSKMSSSKKIDLLKVHKIEIFFTPILEFALFLC
jgi:hypothetical protein